MTRAQLVRLRLGHQQLIRPQFNTPAQVVHWFGAIQSQDYLSSLYAIGVRMRDATQASVEKAFADRSLVRSWPMRRTLHCMAAADARWMIRELAARGIHRMKPYHRKMGITDDHLRRAGRVFEKVLAGDKQLPRTEIYRRLNAAGVPTDTPDGQTRGLHLLCHWAQAGLICIAARRDKQPTFALLEEWTPRGRDLTGDEALAELARRYFQSHSPATVRDFAWWSSLPSKEAQRALQLIGGDLESVTIEGTEYWQMRNAPAMPSQPLPVLLLPAFDEYTVAYADRTAAADPAVLRSISHGLAPNILADGRIAGTWKRTLLAGGAVSVIPSVLRALSKREEAGLATAEEHYARFTGRNLADETPARQPRSRKPAGQRSR